MVYKESRYMSGEEGCSCRSESMHLITHSGALTALARMMLVRTTPTAFVTWELGNIASEGIGVIIFARERWRI